MPHDALGNPFVLDPPEAHDSMGEAEACEDPTCPDPYCTYCRESLADAERGHPETAGCYICTLEAGGDSLAAKGHPERRVVGSFVTPGPDPYHALQLDCGHTII